jgi:hypothetical protein
MAHDYKAKIAALLVKAERTDNEHERDAYNAQAERLMIKMGIEHAELEAAGEVRPEEIVQEHRDWHGNYSIVMVPFVSDIAYGFGNLTILQSKNHNGMVRRTWIIGTKSDVEEFLRLVDSLHVQVMAALKRWQREVREERRYYTDMEKYTGNRSFITAFGNVVGRRLRAMRQEEEVQATPGAALVLASKMDRINDWVGEQHGELRKSRTGAKTYDAMAAAHGAVAGRTANLGEKSIGGSRTALEG